MGDVVLFYLPGRRTSVRSLVVEAWYQLGTGFGVRSVPIQVRIHFNRSLAPSTVRSVTTIQRHSSSLARCPNGLAYLRTTWCLRAT